MNTQSAHRIFNSTSTQIKKKKQCAYFIACKMIDGLKSAHDKKKLTIIAKNEWENVIIKTS